MTTDSKGRRRRRLTATVTDLDIERQRAFLVGVVTGLADEETVTRSVAELVRLTDTAGSDPVDQEIVRRQKLEPATLIGSGQAEDLSALTRALDIDVVVFDHSLSPAQQRNLQKIFGCDVVDREALILDIFAQHATSREGMAQVELALLQYRLPRLTGKGTELSRLGGGIGTRGPGETKLETDRRRITARISRLKRELDQLRQTRATQRKARVRSQLPRFSIVGYTNAGKSTLLNALTGADVLVEDRLFSTLDSTVRRLDLPGAPSGLLSDSVGFVRDLPHHLVEAFQSTLDDVRDADILLHVVDAADPEAEEQMAAVREVLLEIDAAGVPEIVVLNKSDAASRPALARMKQLHPEAVVISAKEADGLAGLTERMVDALNQRLAKRRWLVPYEKGDVLAAIHREADVVETSHQDNGTIVTGRIGVDHARTFEQYET